MKPSERIAQIQSEHWDNYGRPGPFGGRLTDAGDRALSKADALGVFLDEQAAKVESAATTVAAEENANYIFLNGCDGGELTEEMQPEWRALPHATEAEAKEHCLKLAEHLAKRGNFVVTAYRLTEVLTAQLDPKTGEHFVDLSGDELRGVRKPWKDVEP